MLVVSACGGNGLDGPGEPKVETPGFIERTAEVGLDLTSPGFDASLGDFDGDGVVDLYIANHGWPAVLMARGRGDRWRNRLDSAGIDPTGDQHGVTAGDFDNDGDLDLYVTVGAVRGTQEKANRLYRNEGDGTFVDVAVDLGVEDPAGRARSVAWLDVDNDGSLDLLIANFRTPARLFRGRPGEAFVDATRDLDLDYAPHLLAWADVDRDLDPDLLIGGSNGVRLLINESGRFVDQTEASGLADARTDVAAMAFADYDGDGNLDLYLGSGGQYLDSAIEVDGEVRFSFAIGDRPTGIQFDSAAEAVGLEVFLNHRPLTADEIGCGSARSVATPTGGATCSAATARTDGAPAGEGLFVWKKAGVGRPDRWNLRWRGVGDYEISGIVRPASNPEGVRHRAWRPAGGDLYRGSPSGEFSRVDDAGLAHDANVQMVAWHDFDNDGWLDLYVVDGGLPGAGRPNRLFLNQAGRGFAPGPVSAAGLPTPEGHQASAAHAFDADEDGRLDLLLLNGLAQPPFDRGPYRLLSNSLEPRHWIAIALEGDRSNRQGLGAWVEVEACGRRQSRYNDGGRASMSQSALPIHFGIGDCARIESVEVRWPSGVVQRLPGLAVDRMHRVVEPSR